MTAIPSKPPDRIVPPAGPVPVVELDGVRDHLGRFERLADDVRLRDSSLAYAAGLAGCLVAGDMPEVLDELVWRRAAMAAIAEVLRPCAPPDFCEGFDMCTCQTGRAWPCDRTRAAWMALGLDVDTERRRIVAEQRARHLPDMREVDYR